MKELQVNLENCFGIKKLDYSFDFSASNVNVIYARNGLMKTSFAKVFNKVQNGMDKEIEDEIFHSTPVKFEITIDGKVIKKDDIFVINSFESFYESESITDLLVNDSIKELLNNLIKSKTSFFKELEKYSGLKTTKTSSGRKVYEIENTILNDLNFEEKSFLLNLDNLQVEKSEDHYRNIKYINIFDPTNLKKIKNKEFQLKIGDYIKKNDEIYSKYNFLDKGIFTLPKLKDIKKKLDDNNYFVNDNQILLNGNIDIKDGNELNEKIINIENEIKTTKEFKDIEDLLSDSKGMILKDVIENHPEIIADLQIENLNNLRKKLWLSYIKAESEKFKNLKEQFHKLKEKINDTDLDNTPWNKALEIFNQRFSVPFIMSIDNLSSSIIGESVPKVVFSFCKDGNTKNKEASNWVRMDRNELESKDTLSQGEKRALYLLNIIFDVQDRIKRNQKTLFIIDDIADSFDYKNKYAIIEYLEEMANQNGFYMVILSHNFDFYRTITSRLDIGRKNKITTRNDKHGIILENEIYQNQPFKYWKENLNKNGELKKKYLIALIPFVRNMIEYGIDDKINTLNNFIDDYTFLTELLHDKDSTEKITIKMLRNVYEHYIGTNNFGSDMNDADLIYNLILDVADKITSDCSQLENKIVLSITIRLYAEKFMKREIGKMNPDQKLKWVIKSDGKDKEVEGDKNKFLDYIKNSKVQTRKLYKGYIQIGNKQDLEILDHVNIMTPENIHLNSFMYEPILDMDIIELKNLYDEVKSLK